MDAGKGDLTMKTIQFSIDIHAARERVWKTLWEDATFRDWANIIDEGMYIKGELREGEEIQFMSAVNGYGVTSLVEIFRPDELAAFRHRADTQEHGAQEREIEWTGGAESYFLTEKEGMTTLTLKTDVPPEQEETFTARLPQALARIKTLAEKVQPNDQALSQNNKMEQRNLSELTDQELLQEAKKMKSASIINAVLIGFLIGIVFYSVMKNSLGFLTLIPLFFAYKLLNKPKQNNEELEDLLKERNLK